MAPESFSPSRKSSYVRPNSVQAAYNRSNQKGPDVCIFEEAFRAANFPLSSVCDSELFSTKE